MSKLAVLIAVAAVALTGAAEQAAAAKRTPKRPKPPPQKLWYRLAVDANGQYRTLSKPSADQRGSTLDQNMRWTARSRTAFILYRAELGNPITKKLIQGYRFSAGVAGQLTSMDVTDTDYVPTCTPSVRAFRQTAPVGVQGILGGYLPDDQKEASFDADQVRAEVAVPPRRSDTGLNSWSGYRCTNANGDVYSEVGPPPDSPGSAYIPMFCGYGPDYVNMRFDVKGKVKYGRAFTVKVHCEAWWDSATSGAIGSRRTIDYALKFTPCPKGGRTVKGC